MRNFYKPIQRKDDWFKFFGDKWIAGTRCLTDEQCRVYLAVLIKLYEHSGWYEENVKEITSCTPYTTKRYCRVRDELIELKKLHRPAPNVLTNNTVDRVVSNTEKDRSRLSKYKAEREHFRRVPLKLVKPEDT